MKPEDVIPGINFCIEYGLTYREACVFVEIMESPKTMHQLQDKFGRELKTINAQLQRLKLKGLILLIRRNEDNRNVYGLNQKVFEE